MQYTIQSYNAKPIHQLKDFFFFQFPKFRSLIFVHLAPIDGQYTCGSWPFTRWSDLCLKIFISTRFSLIIQYATFSYRQSCSRVRCWTACSNPAGCICWVSGAQIATDSCRFSLGDFKTTFWFVNTNITIDIVFIQIAFVEFVICS